ncbi:hypothetical protein CN533_26245 [Priestia megaterium]|uniref:YkgJ family cysteine cluster protein n=1 Tax=Priestia megaterium TaxID=1404 RepID=UPI000BF3E5F6|nr:YkgJ family cysteine cluster protein [Priestia megaterium]PET68659.1 hypothetical protein CN533_26245 [Priestia megaterium]PFK84769.1 hypothetical protein COJ19_20825 [Priestia megaterium]
MGRNDKCFCGSDKKRKKCHVEVIESSYVEKLYIKYFKIEHSLSEYRKSNEEFKNHTCRNGCSKCCHDVFAVSMLEFELLLEEIRNKGGEFAQNIFNKALKQLDILERDYPSLYNRLEEDDTMRDMRTTVAADADIYSRSHRLPFPCPLLDEVTGSCTSYDKRPMICRTHGTTHTTFDLLSEDTEVCEYIPSRHDNAASTPQIDVDELMTNNLLEVKYNGQTILPRQYPILYWFKIYYDKNLKKGRPIYSSLVPSFFNKKVGTITLAELMP